MTLILKLARLSQLRRQWLLRLLQIELQNFACFTQSKYRTQPFPPNWKDLTSLIPIYQHTYWPSLIYLSSLNPIIELVHLLSFASLSHGYICDILQLWLQIVQSPFPYRRRLNWQTRSTHRTHHSPDRRPQSLTPIFPSFLQYVFFQSILPDKWGRTLSVLYAAVDVLIVSLQSKTWLGSMRPLLKIIALSGKQNSGENGEKWQNNHQILSRRVSCRGRGRKTGQERRGGIVGEYLQIVVDGNSYSIEAPAGPPLSDDHQLQKK